MIDRCGRTYAVNIRLITLPPIVIVAVLAAGDPGIRRSSVMAMVLVSICSVGYVRLLRSGWVRIATAVDAAALSGLALGTVAIVPPDWLFTGKSWLVPFVSFAAVGYQFSTVTRQALFVAVVVSAAMVAGTMLALPGRPDAATVVTAAWSLVASLLARLMWLMVRRGGHRADVAQADVERARRDRAVADAIRADRRLFSSALHDTAATTLLVVGLGHGTDRDMITARANRDLAMLQRPDSSPAVVDLADMMPEALVLVPIDFRLTAPVELAIPPDLARAITGATAEAVSNAARYAGVTCVQVRVCAAAHQLAVEIIDQGHGFDPRAVGSARRVFAIPSSVASKVSAGWSISVRPRSGNCRRIGVSAVTEPEKRITDNPLTPS